MGSLSTSSSSRRRKRKQPKSTSILNSKLTTPSKNLVEQEHLLAKKKSQQEMLRHEADKIVLWRHPICTINYCILELIYLFHHNIKRFVSYRKTLLASIILILFLTLLYNTEGSHQTSVQTIETFLLWSLYWFGLGVASSI
ncbi:unnamed protein product, partial [Rotaria magnacalcarata]